MDRSSAAEDIRRLAQADERLPEAVVKAFDDAMRSSGRSVQSVFDALAVSDSLAAEGALHPIAKFPATLDATSTRSSVHFAFGERTHPKRRAARIGCKTNTSGRMKRKHWESMTRSSVVAKTAYQPSGTDVDPVAACRQQSAWDVEATV